MSKKILSLTCIAVVCVGCGGSNTTTPSTAGLVFFNNTGVPSAPFLYRIPKEGGTAIAVAGSTQQFVGTMDQALEAFTANASGNIIKLVGGVSTSLTSSGQDVRPCVTPDGSRLAFVSNRDGNSEIYTMSGTGSGQANISNSTFNDTFAAISQDGTKVTFTSNRDGNTEIYSANFDGTGLTRLTNDAGDDITSAFTPDGTHIVFSSNRSGVYQLYQMDLTGGNVTQLTTDAKDKFHPSFDVSGTAIFYYTTSGTRQIWRCNPDGSSPLQLTNSTTDCDKMSTWVY